ncbi:MAG: glycosyltransferase family 39 protein [Chloroflexi bacterium]|nr:glycosyltransferase family 39 protein [Chloroflexota bacterium]
MKTGNKFILHPSSFILALPLAVYFALALPRLTLPGLHNDEAAEAGLPAGQILDGQPISAFRDAGLPLGGRIYPLMVQDYIGALNVYLVLPFFALLGPTVVALRLYTVLVGALTLLCTYGFARRAFGTRPAFIAALLLAASPSFIFWQRQGVLVMSLTAALAMACLWAGAIWAQSNAKTAWRWAALLGLLCGAGVYAKLLFVWIIGGVAGALAVINLPIVIRYLFQNIKPHTPTPPHLFPHTPTLPDVFSFTAGLLVGLSPLIIYNLQTGGTLASVGGNLGTSFYGVNNADFFANLRGRWDQFQAVTEGRDHLWYLGGSFGNGGWQTALRLAALVIVGRAAFRRQRSRAPVAILLTLAFGVAQSAFTVSGLFPTHFAIFAPLWPLVVALACETIFNPFYEPMFMRLSGPPLSAFGVQRGRIGFVSMGMAVLAVGLGGLFARDVTVTLDYHRALQQSGGLGPHSDAVYRLTDFLKEAAAPVAAMDWGFAPQVRMLTRGGVSPVEVFGYSWEADAGFADRVSAALDDPATLFVFHVSQETIFPRRAAFEALVVQRGARIEPVTIISRRDGAPVFEVVRLNR